VRPLLGGHRAEEIKTIGDAMMLRCERPADAVRLGLRIVRCVEERSSLPAIRVGVHSGPAVHRHGDWYGSTVNVAARLCSAAGSGEVLVSDHTWRAAGALNGVRVGDERLHWLKNVTEPVAALVVIEDRLAGERDLRWRDRVRLVAARVSEGDLWDRVSERVLRPCPRQAQSCARGRPPSLRGGPARLISGPASLSPQSDGGAT
jgi:hypothetical protein